MLCFCWLSNRQTDRQTDRLLPRKPFAYIYVGIMQVCFSKLDSGCTIHSWAFILVKAKV